MWTPRSRIADAWQSVPTRRIGNLSQSDENEPESQKKAQRRVDPCVPDGEFRSAMTLEDAHESKIADGPCEKDDCESNVPPQDETRRNTETENAALKKSRYCCGCEAEGHDQGSCRRWREGRATIDGRNGRGDSPGAPDGPIDM